MIRKSIMLLTIGLSFGMGVLGMHEPIKRTSGNDEWGRPWEYYECPIEERSPWNYSKGLIRCLFKKGQSQCVTTRDTYFKIDENQEGIEHSLDKGFLHTRSFYTWIRKRWSLDYDRVEAKYLEQKAQSSEIASEDEKVYKEIDEEGNVSYRIGSPNLFKVCKENKVVVDGNTYKSFECYREIRNATLLSRLLGSVDRVNIDPNKGALFNALAMLYEKQQKASR